MTRAEVVSDFLDYIEKEQKQVVASFSRDLSPDELDFRVGLMQASTALFREHARDYLESCA